MASLWTRQEVFVRRIHDEVVDRIHARVRFGAAIALVALMGATLFAGTLSALMRPLIAAVEQVGSAAPSRQRYCMPRRTPRPPSPARSPRPLPESTEAI